MHFTINTHYGNDSYSTISSNDMDLKRLSSGMGEVISQYRALLEEKKNCFYFDGEKALAIYAKRFSLSELGAHSKDNRPMDFCAFFHFDRKECDWLLNKPERLLKFQEWVNTELARYSTDQLEPKKDGLKLMKESIDQISLKPLSGRKEDMGLIRQMKLRILDYWSTRRNNKNLQEDRYYYTASEMETNSRMSEPLIRALCEMPLKFRRISFWMPLMVNDTSNIKIENYGLLNVIQQSSRDLIPLHVTRLLDKPEKENCFAVNILNLIEWMYGADDRLKRMCEIDEYVASPEELMNTLSEAQKLKELLKQLSSPAAKNNKSRDLPEEEILSIWKKDKRVEYFLEQREIDWLRTLEKQVKRETQEDIKTQEQDVDKNYRHLKKHKRSLQKTRILAAFLLVVSAYWINAEILMENQLWIIQINMTPISLLSQVMIFLAGGLFFCSFKNQR